MNTEATAVGDYVQGRYDYNGSTRRTTGEVRKIDTDLGIAVLLVNGKTRRFVDLASCQPARRPE